MNVESEVVVNKEIHFECYITQRIVELRIFLRCILILKKLKKKICFLS